MPDNRDDIIAAYILTAPQTPIEHLAALTTYKRVLAHALSEAPRCFVIVLRHPQEPDYSIYCLAHSTSFGPYVGTVINAIRFDRMPPHLDISGYHLPGGVVPRPDIMFLSEAIKLTFTDVDKQIEEWKGKI